MNQRDKKSLETKERIKTIGIELILSSSFDSVSINQICKKAQVTKGAFYHHFSSKSDLVVEIYHSYILSKINFDPILNQDIPIVEKIRQCILLYIDRFFSQGEAFARQVAVHQITAGYDLHITENEHAYVVIRKLIELGQSQGDIRKDLDSLWLTNTIISYTRGPVYDWFINKKNYDFHVQFEKQLKFFLSALESNT